MALMMRLKLSGAFKSSSLQRVAASCALKAYKSYNQMSLRKRLRIENQYHSFPWNILMVNPFDFSLLPSQKIIEGNSMIVLTLLMVH